MGRTVPELLKSVTSTELQKWKAYERHDGPIGIAKQDTELLLQIQEYLQMLVRYGAIDHGAKAAEVPFHPMPRPWYEYKPEQPEEVKKDKEQVEVAQFAAHFKK